MKYFVRLEDQEWLTWVTPETTQNMTIAKPNTRQGLKGTFSAR